MAAFSPDRLQIARIRRGLTSADLARRLDVASRTIARWEHSEVVPSSDTVDRLATELKFPSPFFFEDSLELVSEDSVSFRAPTKTSAKLKGSTIAVATIGVAICNWIDERFNLPRTDIPTLSGYAAETAASAVRRSWNLGHFPVKNMVHLLEAHGVRIFSLPSDIRDVDAYSFYLRGTPYIFLNTSKTGERQRFDLAHELGHLVMHCDEVDVHGKEREAEAQRFASNFLMPKEDVEGQPLTGAGVETILRAKQRWGVAAMALTHRLHQLELISDWVYRDNCVALAKSGFRSNEPRNAVTPERSQVLDKLLTTLRRRGLSMQAIAADLNLEVEELVQYFFGLAFLWVPNAAEVEAAGPRSKQLWLVK